MFKYTANMYVRNSLGDLITINESNSKQMYNTMWSIKFGKQPSMTGLNTIPVEKMKEYLANKCNSL